jgi:FdhD protein
VPRGRSQTVLVTKIDADGAHRTPDELVVEEPLEIRLDGHRVATTMRTPGNDFELAVGFCFADGLLGDAPVTTVRYCATAPASETAFNVVTVETGGLAPTPTPRLGPVTSSCGLCGSTTLADLAARLEPLPPTPLPVPLAALAGVPATIRDAQGLFGVTGGSHAAAAVARDGEPVIVREDIGRHNAVDKVVGRLLLDHRLPAHDFALFVSGRASFEMVQKAWAAGFPIVVAVSAPSALAVATARTANITLAGFARDGRVNIYAPERPA